MSNRFAKALTLSIQRHFSLSGQSCAQEDDMMWLLLRWPVYDHKTRILDSSDIQQARKIIAIVPSGKQRHYRRALNDILFYLQDACHWTLPELSQPSIRDKNYEWFEAIACESANANQAFNRYQIEKDHFFTKRGTLSPAFIAMMIGFEIAPLSLQHICQIINEPDSITSEISHPRLRVLHQTSTTDEPRYTHYHLPLVCWRLLLDYYAQQPQVLSGHELYQHVTQWTEKNALSPARPLDWPRRFQIGWYVRHRLPPVLLKDLATPERHVSLPKQHQTSNLQVSDIYAIDWDLNWFEHCSPNRQATHWPHSQLLNASTSRNPTLLTPTLDAGNILPRMLFDYTQHLLTEGGVRKPNLAIVSIKHYTRLKSALEPHPLSYADAINEEAINLWAHTVYDSLSIDSDRKYFHYFLRYLSVQELTDGLDISEFAPPTIPPSVSAARLDLIQLDTLIHTLITSNTTHPFRSLFAVGATILGFFGMLRRGEVLRLRRQDIQFVPSSGLLMLSITSTAEGRTKNSQSRKVYTTIPKRFRNLIRVILTVKQDVPPSAPLLGFEGEKYHSRQLYYLLPVSRALKVLFGSHVRFHHLRHSGIHVLKLQALHWVSQTPLAHRGSTALEREVMSNVSVATRFDYWLEGRDLKEVNEAILIDEMCEQIGHVHYATTRWSYLHDIDWLLPIISQAHQSYVPKEYTHSELRYVLGLSAHSNDLSRRLKQLSPEYAAKSLTEKRGQTIRLTEQTLRAAILVKPKRQEQAPIRDHFKNWQSTIPTSSETLVGYLFHAMMKNQSLDLSALSQVWSLSCRHDIHPVNKKQRTALKNLPAIKLTEDMKTLRMTLPCNIKNARAFTTAFRHKDWDWLALHFEISVNRKLNPERQTELLKTHFVRGEETVSIKHHPSGNTALSVVFQPKTSLPRQILVFTEQFITSLQNNEDTI